MALGNNYLESFGRRRKEDDNENDNNDFYAENNNSGGGFANSWNPGGGRGTSRTAVRPPSSLTSRNNGNFNNNNINNGRGGGGIVPLVVSINQPQDLLDFVIRDERLSVGEFPDCMIASAQSLFLFIVCLIKTNFLPFLSSKTNK
jgi:hypothetical protein